MLVQMLSKTGCGSSIERLTTRNTSAVAVCCSNASFVSLNSRAFWIAITAWSAKVPSSDSSLPVKGLGGWRSAESVPMPRPSHTIGAQAIEQCPEISTTLRTDAGGSASVDVSATWMSWRSRMTRSVMVSPSGLGKVRATADRAGPRHAAACTCSSSRTRKMPSCSVANRCSQLSRILSNTGPVSATELLITLSTSADAVCCSRARCVSSSRRAFSSAVPIDAATVCSSRTSASP